jgi:hypothetical protein
LSKKKKKEREAITSLGNTTPFANSLSSAIPGKKFLKEARVYRLRSRPYRLQVDLAGCAQQTLQVACRL